LAEELPQLRRDGALTERDRSSWDARLYGETSRYVSDLGAPLVELLAPRPGERILDLGCGDGALTEKIVASGADVLGVDASEAMVREARARGLKAEAVGAYELDFESEFDGVFSNAAMHWMKRPDEVIQRVKRALRPGGRFVAEFGGGGNVDAVSGALRKALAARGVDYDTLDPWYFPSLSEYRNRLESQGFGVDHIELFDRPTPIPGDLAEWLGNFGNTFLDGVSEGERLAVVDEVTEAVRPKLCDDEGRWSIDYVRLRFAARAR